MKRRDLITTGAVLFVLEGCGGPSVLVPGTGGGGGVVTPPPSPSDPLAQAIQFAQSLETGVGDILNNLPGISGLLGGSYTTLQKAFAAITAATGKLTGLTSSAGAATIVSQLVSAGISALSVLGVALPPPFDLIVPALAAVIPALANLFNIGVSASSRRFATVYTPLQAVGVIDAVHRQVAR